MIFALLGVSIGKGVATEFGQPARWRWKTIYRACQVLTRW